MSLHNDLPPVTRSITAHSPSGESIILTTIPSDAEWRHIPTASFYPAYVTTTFPINLRNDEDIPAYLDFLAGPPKATVEGGTILRVVDLGPNTSMPMHRTRSLDYTVILEGEVELEMDSGDTKIMGRGEICVQRATNHLWRNVSETAWARMLYVTISSTGPIVDGEELGQSTENWP
jgi:quercetin dioxygenase-like cupin family protein